TLPAALTQFPSSPLSPTAIPPESELDTLLNLALMGDLKGVVAYAERIEQQQQQWAPFTTQLKQLALSYKGRQAIDLIKRYQPPA
ncbi:hypothetical protein, partial [Phormidium tenue]